MATFLAAPAQGKVLSFEHYRYADVAADEELDRLGDAILATLRIKSPASVCPTDVLTQGLASRGACVEPAVLGDAVVAACASELQRRGWQRDDTTASVIGKRADKKLVCYRRPDAAGPP